MAKRTHTLHLVEYLAQGGIERLLEQLARYTPSHRAKLSFFSYETATLEGIGKELVDLGVPVITYKKKKGYDLRLLKKLVQVVRAQKITVIHTHDFGPMEYAVALKIRFPKLRLIHTHHTLHHFLKFPKYVIFLQAASHLYYQLIAVSEHVKDQLQESCPWVNSNIIVIPNGIALDHFSSSRGQSAPKLRLVNVSRISPEKNLKYLLQTCALLKAAGIDFEFHHAGSGPKDLQDEIAHFISLNGLQNEVHLYGFQNDVRPILKRGNIFVSSSLSEGHPVAVLEAMASGKACLISDIEPHRNLAPGAVKLFSLSDEQALAKELMELLKDPKLILKLARKGKSEVRKHFGIERMVESYCGLYG